MSRIAVSETDRETIERCAKDLATARKELEQKALAAGAALGEVRCQWNAVLRLHAARVAHLEAALLGQVEQAPDLFKRPQSIEVDGVRFGWRKGKGSMELPEQKTLIKRMGRVLTKAQRSAIVQVKIKVLKGPLSRLSGELLKKLGIDLTGSGPEAFVTYPKSDVQKLIDWWMKPIGAEEDDD